MCHGRFTKPVLPAAEVTEITENTERIGLSAKFSPQLPDDWKQNTELLFSLCDLCVLCG
jgi:hypothetical protein